MANFVLPCISANISTARERSVSFADERGLPLENIRFIQREGRSRRIVRRRRSRRSYRRPSPVDTMQSSQTRPPPSSDLNWCIMQWRSSANSEDSLYNKDS